MSEQKSNSISTADILGVMFIVGAPDFFKDQDEASKFMFKVYREWNPRWPATGKLLSEIDIETVIIKKDVPAGPQGIVDLASLARETEFAKSFPPHSMYVQGIVLTEKSWEEQGRPKIQACFLTFTRNSADLKVERLIIVNGALDLR